MNVQQKSKFEQEFPFAAVRQKKVMDKMARCHFCDRLCCCIKHLLEHEKQHLTQDKENVAAQAEHNCPEELRGWVDATESILVTCAKKINFPLFCVYCKICIKGERYLRYLIQKGSPCPLKDSHWLVSLKKYIEITGCSDLRLDIKEQLVATNQFVDYKDKSLRWTNCTKHKSRHHSFWLSYHKNFGRMESSSISNTNSSPLTVSSQGEVSVCTPKDTSSIVERMQPFSTSTPQDICIPSALDMDLSLPVSHTPECGPQSILSIVKNDHKPKGNLLRKVTFSTSLETTESKTTDGKFFTKDRPGICKHDDMKNDNGDADSDNPSTEKRELKNEENENDIIVVLEQINKKGENADSELSVWKNIIDKQNKIKIENLEEIQRKRAQNQISECNLNCETKFKETDEISMTRNQSEQKSKIKENKCGLELKEDKLQTTAEGKIEDLEGNEDFKREEEKNLVDSSIEWKEGHEIKNVMHTEDDKSSEDDDLEYHSMEDAEKGCNELKNSHVYTSQSRENELESLVSSTVESPSGTLAQINNELQTVLNSKNVCSEEKEISNKENLPSASETNVSPEIKYVSSGAQQTSQELQISRKISEELGTSSETSEQLQTSSKTPETNKFIFKQLQTSSKYPDDEYVSPKILHATNTTKQNESASSILSQTLGETLKEEIVMKKEFQTINDSSNKTLVSEVSEVSSETTKNNLICSKLLQSSSDEALKEKPKITTISEVIHTSSDSSDDKTIISEVSETSSETTRNDLICSKLLQSSSDKTLKEQTKMTKITEVVQTSKNAATLNSMIPEASESSSEPTKIYPKHTEPLQTLSETSKRKAMLSQVFQNSSEPLVSEPRNSKLIKMSRESSKKTRCSEESYTSNAVSNKTSVSSKVLQASDATSRHKLKINSGVLQTGNVETYYDGPCTSQIYETEIEHGATEHTFSSPGESFAADEPKFDDKSSDVEQEWSFTKFTSAISTSWNKAKNLVMQSFRTKRENFDYSSEEDSDEIHAKRIKLSHSNESRPHTSPVQRKSKQNSVQAYNYNIKSRRPLPRMQKKGSW